MECTCTLQITVCLDSCPNKLFAAKTRSKAFFEKYTQKKKEKKTKFLFRVVNCIGCGKLSSQCLSTCGLNIFMKILCLNTYIFWIKIKIPRVAMPIANYRAFSSSTRSLAFAIGFGYWFTHKNEMEQSLYQKHILCFQYSWGHGLKKNTHRHTFSAPAAVSVLKSIGYFGQGRFRN